LLHHGRSSAEIYELGKKLFEEGKYSEAEPLLLEVIRANPRYADVQNKLGIITTLTETFRQLRTTLRRQSSSTPATPRLAESA